MATPAELAAQAQVAADTAVTAADMIKAAAHEA